MKKIILGLALISSVSAFADCKVLDDTLQTKLSTEARQEVLKILSSKGYATSFDGQATHVLRLIDIAQGSYTSNDIFYGIDARLLSPFGETLTRGMSTKVSQDEKFVFDGSWIDQSTVEAVKNLESCEN